MITLNQKDLTERENYKLLIGSIIPRPVALITTKNENGTTNAAPFSYLNVVSSKPAIISLSVKRKNHELKDTARNILRENNFVLHVASTHFIEQINKTSKPLAYNESEVTYANLTLVDSIAFDTKAIKEAKIRMELKLHSHIIISDNNLPETDLFLGEVINYHIDDELYEAGRINEDLLNPISRLAGNTYATLGQKITIEREI